MIRFFFSLSSVCEPSFVEIKKKEKKKTDKHEANEWQPIPILSKNLVYRFFAYQYSLMIIKLFEKIIANIPTY